VLLDLSLLLKMVGVEMTRNADLIALVFSFWKTYKNARKVKSARPGSNRRDDLGRVACYHYTTGAHE
jgi:hypothetical protein